VTTNENPPAEQDRGAEVSEGTDRHRVTHADDVPEYSSTAWWQLPVDDWRRTAAVTIAANRWATIAESAYGWALLEEAEQWHNRFCFSDWSSTISEMVKGRTIGPSHAELERRRAVVGPLPAEFAQRHGHPYCGGAVDWETGRPEAGSSGPASREAA
jgi:hypothetical protein